MEREYLLLDSDWKFLKGAVQVSKDVKNDAHLSPDPQHYTLRDGATAPIGAPCADNAAAACDDSSWITVTVPFNWVDLGADMDTFRGEVWYRKHVSLTAAQLDGRRAVLRIGAAAYRAWVYVNGKEIGAHEGGYTPFEFDVTDALRPGDNLVAVKVNNALGDLDITIGDWWNYGGIHREVWLEFSSPEYIADLAVHATPDLATGMGVAAFATRVVGDADTVRYYVYRLSDTGKELIAQEEAEVSGQGLAEAQWAVQSPALWSPDSPALYFVKAVLLRDGAPVDGAGSVFGFRTFEVLGKKLYLNGEEIFLRGVNRHDEFFHGEMPDAGRVADEQMRIADFQLIKDMHANSMRTGHYPNHEYNYAVTDRLGILVIEEGGTVDGPLNEPEYIDKMKRQLTEMYERDKNHPSIVMWSIGNEFYGDMFVDYVRESSKLMRALDPVRPLIFTSRATTPTVLTSRFVDVIAFNEYSGWYGAKLGKEVNERDLWNAMRFMLETYSQKFKRENSKMPVVILEMGAESICGQHAANPDEYTTRGDEEYQEAVIKLQYRYLLKNDHIVGIFPWIFADFKTRSPGGTCQFTPHLNRKGLVCPDRTKKRAWFLVQKVYKSLENKAGE